MSNVWGRNLKISIFGESHGKAIGITIDGLPSGVSIDLDKVKAEMQRRAPGNSKLTTERKERDSVEILSGYFDGKTTGTPICGVIYNEDKRSRDYSQIKNLMRPGHGDYTGHIRYSGHNDYRGGGHFSGRLTAPLVFAGGIAKQILADKGIEIVSHVRSIKDKSDISLLDTRIDKELIQSLGDEKLPVIDKNMAEVFEQEILKAKAESNSVGGSIEVAVLNCPAGLGDPFFDSLESSISSLAFSVPAVKGIEFGRGFDITRMYGSEANDQYTCDGDRVVTLSNNNGGILGGISNGMPIIFTVGIKPTPSIGIEQSAIDIRDNSEKRLTINGRHDPCIVPRALPVMESVAALAVLDYVLRGDRLHGESR